MKARFTLACLLFVASAVLTHGESEPSALVSVATVRLGSLAPEISAYGTVASDPNHQLAVVVGHEARVLEVFVRAGEPVHKDDPLIKIQNSPASIAQYAQASAAAAFAAKDLQQTQRLFSEQLATRSQLAAAQRAYADADAALGQQRLMGADRLVETLSAPEDGIVIALNAVRGEAVTAGTNVATIARPTSLVVNLGVELRDASDVHLGAPVKLSLPNGSIAFRAQISSIAAMLDSQSRLVNAVVRVPDAIAPKLFVGTTLRARIGLVQRKGIVIPSVALLSDSHGTFVLTDLSGIAHRRAVKVAFQNGDSALIDAGLHPNEQVLVRGLVGVTDGMHIRTR